MQAVNPYDEIEPSHVDNHYELALHLMKLKGHEFSVKNYMKFICFDELEKDREAKALLESVPSSEKKDASKRWTDFHEAAAFQWGVQIKEMQKQGLDIHIRCDKFGHNDTLLHHAAVCNNGDGCEYLIEAGIDVNAQSLSGSTPLHYAACYDALDAAICLLWNGAHLEALSLQNSTRETPLCTSARLGNRRMTELLLDAGANPDYPQALQCARSGTSIFSSSSIDPYEYEEEKARAEGAFESGDLIASRGSQDTRDRWLKMTGREVEFVHKECKRPTKPKPRVEPKETIWGWLYREFDEFFTDLLDFS